MQQSLDFHIESVMRLPRDNRFPSQSAQARSARCAWPVVLDRFDASNRILDCMVTCTPTKIALQDARQILTVLLAKGCRRHNHPRRAETALKSSGVQESSLHRMQLPVLREPFNGRHLTAFSTKGGNQTAM